SFVTGPRSPKPISRITAADWCRATWYPTASRAERTSRGRPAGRWIAGRCRVWSEAMTENPTAEALREFLLSDVLYDRALKDLTIDEPLLDGGLLDSLGILKTVT